MKLNRVHHIAVICSDYQRSLDFYTRVLGLTVLAETYREERQSYKTNLGLGDNYIVELFSFPNPPARIMHPEATGLSHLAFEVDNIEESIHELEAMAVAHEAIRVDPTTGMRLVFFHDPDGLPIELYEKRTV